MGHKKHQESGSAQTGHGGGAFTSAVLQLSGFGLIALGVALRFAPDYSWQIQRISTELSAEAITPTFVAFAGFVAFGFGLIHSAARAARNQVHHSDEQDKGPDFELVATEFAGGLQQVKEALKTLGHHFSLANHEQRTFQETLMNKLEVTAESSGKNDSMFQLAAGIDKLHEIIDRQIGGLAQKTEGQAHGLGKRVGSLGTELGHIQELLKSVLVKIESMPVAVASPTADFEADQALPEVHASHLEQAPAPAHTPPARQHELPPAAQHDIYASEPVTSQPEVAPEEEQVIDTDRMVEEGLEVLVQLEEGLAPGAARTPADEQEFFEKFASSGDNQHEATTHPVLDSQPEPPPALPSSVPSKEEALDALLSEDALRDALGGGH